MSGRSETLLWIAQRGSAVVLAGAVFVHIGTIIFISHLERIGGAHIHWGWGEFLDNRMSWFPTDSAQATPKRCSPWGSL